MPQNILQVYIDQLPVLESEEMLGNILASDMPHARESDRKGVFRSLKRVAGVEEVAHKIDPETEGGRQVAAGMGIGIYIERPEPPTEAPDGTGEGDEGDEVESSEEMTD